MTIIIEVSERALASKGAAMFSRAATTSLKTRGRFAAALSGGSTPRPMHRLLCQEPYLSTIPWDNTHIFWVDERCVSINDPESNYGAARADFLNCVPIPESQVHPMPSDLQPEEGAMAYEKELMGFFQTGPSEIPALDLICLGIGDDGHTASLFPGHRTLDEKKRLIIPARGGKPAVDRLTMTLPLINNARNIVFVVSGRGKATILKAILDGSPTRFPAQMVFPVTGQLTYLLDKDAASMLH